jgi:predicted ATPase with chaperone activity
MDTIDFSTLSLEAPLAQSFSGPPVPGVPQPTSDWMPHEPQTLAETGLDPSDIEALIVKLLLSSGATVGRRIAEQVRLPFGLVAEVLRGLKAQLLVNYKSQAAMGDFEYELTEDGQRKARWEVERCTYCGAAPVPLDEYIASVARQSVRKARPKLPQVAAALADLTLPPAIISQVGQAVYAGRSLFLYGRPGNGKTSIAERTIRAISHYIWLPRTITVTGEIIRLFDPRNHQEAPLENGAGQLLDTLQYDRRWVRIRRPCIVVGGELKLEQLEITSNAATGIIEAPVQLKSNCGALVVDDFGRQRCSTSELLNRWIVPLEKGQDFLNLPSGRQIQVPFDQLLVFSTNLEPEKLVDEAFLRRIPYKIEVQDPSAREFRELSKYWCEKLGIEYLDDVLQHALAKHFIDAKRPIRYCQPRDLMLQVRAFCEFHDLPMVLTQKGLDVAVKNYFAGL